MPVMSAGIRSGVNWMRLKDSERLWASVRDQQGLGEARARRRGGSARGRRSRSGARRRPRPGPTITLRSSALIRACASLTRAAAATSDGAAAGTGSGIGDLRVEGRIEAWPPRGAGARSGPAGRVGRSRGARRVGPQSRGQRGPAPAAPRSRRRPPAAGSFVPAVAPHRAARPAYGTRQKEIELSLTATSPRPGIGTRLPKGAPRAGGDRAGPAGSTAGRGTAGRSRPSGGSGRCPASVGT